METHDTLMAIAQVAATFAGFTGIVIVFGRRAQGDWRYFDQVAIRLLLLGNLGVVFFSFIPDVAAAAHIGNAGSWRVASGLLASYQLGVLCWSAVARRRDIASGSERLPRSGIPILTSGVAIIFFMFAVAAGLANEWLSFAYLLGLLWMLGISTFIFGVLMLEVSRPAA